MTARKAAEPDPPMSVAELRRQFETEAQAMVGPTGDRGTALLRFAQTERGKHLNRQLQIAMQHEHEARQRGGVTKQAPVGSPAWQRIEQAAEALIAKASTSLTKAQAIDRVVRDDPGLYAGHLAEVRPPVSGPTAAWAQIERRAAEIVEKSAHGVSKAKAVRQAIERDPGLYAEHVAQQRARV